MFHTASAECSDRNDANPVRQCKTNPQTTEVGEQHSVPQSLIKCINENQLNDQLTRLEFHVS